jgi:solute carrier family 45, member 1/2/4
VTVTVNLQLVNTMTGFNALPIVDEAAPDGSAQWAGVARVVGPLWARFPATTIGLAGVQVTWSIELAYGEQLEKGKPTSALNDQKAIICSLAISHLPWPHQIPRLPRPHCWSPFWSHRPASHRSARDHPLSPSTLSADSSLPGVIADNSKSRFGRRRPFIVAGVAICSMALILLGFTRNVASLITTWGSPAVSITPFRHAIQDADKNFRTMP